MNKDWRDLRFGPHNALLLYGFKALLHSVICGDGYEETWLKRVNDTLKIFSVENLQMTDMKDRTATPRFLQNNDQYELREVLDKWIAPLIIEGRRKTAITGISQTLKIRLGNGG